MCVVAVPDKCFILLCRRFECSPKLYVTPSNPQPNPTLRRNGNLSTLLTSRSTSPPFFPSSRLFRRIVLLRVVDNYHRKFISLWAQDLAPRCSAARRPRQATSHARTCLPCPTADRFPCALRLMRNCLSPGDLLNCKERDTDDISRADSRGVALHCL